MTMTMGFDTTSAAPSPSTETAGTESRDAMMRGAIVQQSNPSSCAVSETFSPIESPKLRPLVCPAAPNYPAYPSSLPYTTVRDFAYPVTHPLHYGPPPRDPSREQDGSQAHGSGGARREGGGERDGPCSPPDWNPDA
ncbi:HOG (high osmolarity glycerol) pathway protein, partial [Ascosphaera atra]